MGTPGGCKPINPEFVSGEMRWFCAQDVVGNRIGCGPSAVRAAGFSGSELAAN